MLNEKISKLINEQITKEFYSAYLYLEFANKLEDDGLNGFANWYTIQAQEERDHALIFRNFLLDNGVRVTLDTIAKPEGKFDTIEDILNGGIAHEEYITKSITDIYAVAFEEKDFKTMQFLDWFIKEQVEEEKNANDMLTKYKLFGNDAKGLYMLNNELAGRTYTPTAMLARE